MRHAQLLLALASPYHSNQNSSVGRLAEKTQQGDPKRTWEMPGRGSQPTARCRHSAGVTPTHFLNARLNAASDSSTSSHGVLRRSPTSMGKFIRHCVR